MGMHMINAVSSGLGYRIWTVLSLTVCRRCCDVQKQLPGAVASPCMHVAQDHQNLDSFNDC